VIPVSDEVTDWLRARRAAVAASRAAWAERVERLMFLCLGIPDDTILAGETADFLVHEEWLLKRELAPEVMSCSLTALTDFAVRRDNQLTREESLTAALARASVEAPARKRRRRLARLPDRRSPGLVVLSL